MKRTIGGILVCAVLTIPVARPAEAEDAVFTFVQSYGCDSALIVQRGFAPTNEDPLVSLCPVSEPLGSTPFTTYASDATKAGLLTASVSASGGVRADTPIGFANVEPQAWAQANGRTQRTILGASAVDITIPFTVEELSTSGTPETAADLAWAILSVSGYGQTKGCSDGTTPSSTGGAYTMEQDGSAATPGPHTVTARVYCPDGEHLIGFVAANAYLSVLVRSGTQAMGAIGRIQFAPPTFTPVS